MERSAHLELPDEVRRLVILGDPHGDLAGLEAVWAREGGEGVALFSPRTAERIVSEEIESAMAAYGSATECYGFVMNFAGRDLTFEWFKTNFDRLYDAFYR